MDNASKALIMAGGLLIGLFVVSFSMYLLTAFRSFYSQNMQIHTAYEINAYNSYFTKYKATISGLDAYNILSRAEDVNFDSNSRINISTPGNLKLNNYKKVFYYYSSSISSISKV